MPTRNDTVHWWRRSPTNGGLWSIWSTGVRAKSYYCDEFDPRFGYNADSRADFECSDSEALDIFFKELEVAR